VYSLLGLTFVTIALLVLLNVYALEIFLVMMIIEFLGLFALTNPASLRVSVEKEHDSV
jgi:hypothetical protein